MTDEETAIAGCPKCDQRGFIYEELGEGIRRLPCMHDRAPLEPNPIMHAPSTEPAPTPEPEPADRWVEIDQGRYILVTRTELTAEQLAVLKMVDIEVRDGLL